MIANIDSARRAEIYPWVDCVLIMTHIRNDPKKTLPKYLNLTFANNTRVGIKAKAANDA